MRKDITGFIDDYIKEMEAGQAAVFAGAGLSVPAGFVDWRHLLAPLAVELDLDIAQETDFIALAQFHVNANSNNRSQLNKAIIEAFSTGAKPTESHRLLAGLPIATWWTTNYDNLIERALSDAGKIPDVKHTVAQLANTKPRRDAIVFKMHGDVDHPDQAVATRDDYERYAGSRGAYINALSGDFVNKTFLFLGFSFTDPNLEAVLSRIRQTFEGNQRRHYAIFKNRTQNADEDDAVFINAKTRQSLVLRDLERFNIKPLMIDDYPEVPVILGELVKRYRRRTIFVSASASDFGVWGEAQVTGFMRRLGATVMDSEVRLVTGLGLGVGNALFTGAVEQVVRKGQGHMEDRIIVRPFPQALPDPDREDLWETYRQTIVAEAGVALFMFGNKEVGGAIQNARGVEREFEIAREHGLVVLPIGATGSMASVLASRALADPDVYLSELDGTQRAQLAELAKPVADLATLIEPIMALVRGLKGVRK